ncbi:hypothetical protein ['Paenibacillus yunnanensis' Narsing Rao et al. 2020]|uniref:hypothetical protein n=1 Tax=Paenibacillus tengchongensis TaxID=2608684 RepID=UPI0016527D82|nr:hypothetical protein [Paenibacillus tengchongensis]
MKKILITLLCACILCLGLPGLMVQEDAGAAAAKNVMLQSAGKVNVGGKSYVEILEPQLVQWGKDKVLSFQVRLFNGDQAQRDMLRYGITVTGGGETVNAQRVGDPSGSTKVLPQSSKEFAFYAVVPKSAALAHMKFNIKEWNINYEGFSKPVGSIQLGASYTPAVAAGNSKITVIGGSQTGLTPGAFYSYETANGRVYTLSLTLQSWGNHSAQLPDYSYWLQANTGEIYALTSGGENSGKELAAKAGLVQDLSAEIPKSSKAASFKLLMGLTEDSIPLIQYMFSLPAAGQWSSIAAVKQQTYYIRPDNNPLALTVEPLYITETDLPQWKAGTVITLKNNGKQTVERPELAFFLEAGKSTYLLDGESTAGDESLDALEQLKIPLSGEIPSTLRDAKLKLIIAKSLKSGTDQHYKPLLKLALDKSSEVVRNPEASTTVKAVSGGTPYELSVSSLLRYESGSDSVLEGTITARNVGTKALELPDFSMGALINRQYSYDADISGQETGMISPQSQVMLSFKVQYPQSLEATGVRLQLSEPLSQGGEGLLRPVAEFDVTDWQSFQPPTGNIADFETAEGTYRIQKNTSYRLPLGSKDELVTEFELYSGNYESKALPELKAVYRLGNTQVEADVAVLDEVIHVAYNKPVSVQVIGKIPYTMNPGEISILLQATDGGTDRAAGQFRIDKLAEVPVYAPGDKYSVSITGKETSFELYQVLVYPGQSEDLLEVQLVQRNGNRRGAINYPLYGYLQDKNGLIYELEQKSSTAEDTAKYGSTAIQSLAGKVPKDTLPKELKLVFGMALSGNSIAVQSGGTADAYVKPVAFALPDKANTADKGLYRMNAYPFVLDISNPWVRLESGYSGYLEFNAAVGKQLAFDYFDQDHKIVIELVSGSETVAQKEFGLYGSGSGSFTATNSKYRIEGISGSLQTGSMMMKAYLQYKGEKLLLGSQWVSVDVKK